MIKDKFKFWIKTAGWSGLIAAMGVLELYQMSNNWIFLADLILIIIFSGFLLATNNEPFWKNRKSFLLVLLFCIICISILPAIFLWLAYRRLPKNN